MKKLDAASKACYELENLALTKLATKTASELQSPILVYRREVLCGKLVYRTYFRSHLSSQEILVAHHQSPEEFCLWFVAAKKYREFELVNFTNLTKPYV